MATGAIDKEFIIDITEISEFIIDTTKIYEPAKWRPECCIYTVPKRLRKINEEAYTPKLISIGPVHHYKDKLLKFKDMEWLKLKYFKEFFDLRSKVQMDFANIVVKNKMKIRCCYEADISLPKEDDELVKMILLDSIFIIELFLRTYARKNDKDNDELSTEKDYILSKPWLDDDIRQDLILLENQLPFFILDELYDYFARSTKGVPERFLTLAWNYFFPYKKMVHLWNVKHFTDLQRSFHCPLKLKTGKIIEHLYSATKLNEAGVKFQKWEKKKLEHRCYSAKEEEEEEYKFLLDLEIKKPCPHLNCSWLVHCLPCLKYFSCVERLENCLHLTSVVLPRFVADNKTEGVFRNIMALEQCHYPFNAYICNYIVLLIFLINTKEDVELLVENRIIDNAFGSNTAVAELVRNLGREIVEANSCYYALAEDLNSLVMNTTFLKTVYFRDIWRGTSSVLGVLVTCATIGSFLTTFMMKK